MILPYLLFSRRWQRLCSYIILLHRVKRCNESEINIYSLWPIRCRSMYEIALIGMVPYTKTQKGDNKVEIFGMMELKFNGKIRFYHQITTYGSVPKVAVN